MIRNIVNADRFIGNVLADLPPDGRIILQLGFHNDRDRFRSVGKWSFGVGPHARRFTVVEEFQVNNVGVAADGTVFDVLLFVTGRSVERYDDLLATSGTDVGSLVAGAPAFLSSLIHSYSVHVTPGGSIEKGIVLHPATM
jgi:hypothetical protein